MRSPRKLFSLVALLTLGLGLAACGDVATTQESATDGNATSDTAAETFQPVVDGNTVLADPTAAGATGTSGKTGASACDDTCKQSGACSEKCKDGGSACCDKQKEAAVCACAQGKAGEPVWCESCKKGFVDGKEVCCPSCVENAQKKISDGTQ